MKTLLLFIFLTLTYLSFPSSVHAQIIIDCSNCVNAVWGETCTGTSCGGADPNAGCVSEGAGCCGCARGFLFFSNLSRNVPPPWIGGGYNPRRRIFHVTFPGGIPDLQQGDEIHGIGSTSTPRVTRRSIPRYTLTNPARRLRLRVFRPSTGTWLTINWRG